MDEAIKEQMELFEDDNVSLAKNKASKKLDTDLKELRGDRKETFDKMTEMLTSGKVNDMSVEEKEKFVTLYKMLKQHHNFSEGGCNATTRTLEVHNDCWVKLQKKFPNFVKVYTKPEEKSGMGKGQKRLGGVVQWKKAYESSKISTLDQFMV